MSATREAFNRRRGQMPPDKLDELIGEMRRYHATSSEFMARLMAAGITNGVLEVGTDTIPSSGVLTRAYHVQVGSMIVINAGAAAVTAVPGAPGPVAPQIGAGVQPIPAQTLLALPVNDHAWSVWGTVGATVGFQVFTGLQAFGVSL